MFFYTLVVLGASGLALKLVYDQPTNINYWLYLLAASYGTYSCVHLLWSMWTDIRMNRIKALQGDPKAMYELSLALRQTDTTDALYWAEKAASLGHCKSNFLAGFLRYGFGMHDQLTFDYFSFAAEKGSEPAMRALADCYKLGHCVLPNDRLSFEWRFKSASNWSADFQSRHFGALDSVDPDKAPGYVCSRYAVGMCYLRGEGCEKNEVEGYAWLLLAARARHTGAINKVRELDRRKAFKLRAQMHDRSLEIAKAFDKGTELVPIAATGTTTVSEAKPATVGQAFDGSDSPEDAPEPVSAWRAFFTVFLSGNLLMAFLLIGANSSDGSPIRPEVNGALYAGFIAAAVMAALYGRKLHPALNLLLLAVTSVAVASTLAFLGAPSMALSAAGASLATGALVIPGSVILIHWRHPVSTFLFYVLIFIHSIGLVSAMLV
jgi:TPR repeat protein